MARWVLRASSTEFVKLCCIRLHCPLLLGECSQTERHSASTTFESCFFLIDGYLRKQTLPNERHVHDSNTKTLGRIGSVVSNLVRAHRTARRGALSQAARNRSHRHVYDSVVVVVVVTFYFYFIIKNLVFFDSQRNQFDKQSL